MNELLLWLEGLWAGSLAFAARLPAVIGIFAVGMLLMRALRRGIDRLMAVRRVDETLVSMARGVISFFGWVLILAGIANVLGLNELSLALGGSIAVIGFGLASGLSGTVADLIAGVFLLADPDFRVGRRVKAGAIEGSVRNLDVRKTKVLDSEGNLHIIPNRTLDSGPVMVYAQEKAVATDIQQGQS